MAIFEEITKNIIEREVREFTHLALEISFYPMTTTFEPMDNDNCIGFKSTFTLKERVYEVNGLIDEYGKVSIGDLICDNKVVIKLY